MGNPEFEILDRRFIQDQPTASCGREAECGCPSGVVFTPA